MTPVGGNVFVELGFPSEEAASLKARSNEIIAREQRAGQQSSNAAPDSSTDS